MRKFLKKQFTKLLIYTIILLLITILFFYYNLDKNTLLSIISLITSIFIAFMSKTWIEDYKLEIDKEKKLYEIKYEIYNKINEELVLIQVKISKLTNPIFSQKEYDQLIDELFEISEKLSTFSLNNKINILSEIHQNILSVCNFIVPNLILNFRENKKSDMEKEALLFYTTCGKITEQIKNEIK